MAQVIIAESAIEDLNRVAEYIALVNEPAARALVARVLVAIENLEKHPRIGPHPPEFTSKTYRHLIEHPVRIFYREEGDCVYVVHIYRMEMDITSADFKE
jgi:toxin ParE1/3/4